MKNVMQEEKGKDYFRGEARKQSEANMRDGQSSEPRQTVELMGDKGE